MHTEYRIPNTVYSIALFALLLAALLIGQRLGFAWAGGEGYVPERGAGVVEVVGSPDIDRNGTLRDAELWHAVARGETVRTGAGERVRLRLSFAHEIALDENTDLTIESNTSKGIVVRLSRGRAYVDTHLDARGDQGELGDHVTVRTNFTSSTIRYGAMSVVNYDFREVISVAPIETTAAVTVDGNTVEYAKPIDIHETPPVSVTETAFDPTSGAAAEFYRWALTQ